MTRDQRRAAALAERYGPLADVVRERLVPRDFWLIAKAPIDVQYPCRCGPLCGQRCPCRGRDDAMTMPPHCCARRIAQMEVRDAARA